MIEPRSLRSQIGYDIAQAVPLGQMGRRKRHELGKPRHPPQRRANMVGLRERLKLMSGNKPQELAENRAMVTQGLVLRCESMVCRNSIVSPTREPGRLYFNPCGTAVTRTAIDLTR
jgi:hypothetical protein